MQDSFAEEGLVKDLKVLAPEKQLEVMQNSVALGGNKSCEDREIIGVLCRFLFLDSTLLPLETAWQ